MGIIEAAKLAFEYKKYDENGEVEETIRAVDGVDLDVKKGDFVAILGHNGSGKSTLAKQINAILTPTDGTLYVDGMDVRDEKNIWEVRKTAGMVFQNPGQPDHRYGGRRRCRIRTGKHGNTDRGDLGES